MWTPAPDWMSLPGLSTIAATLPSTTSGSRSSQMYVSRGPLRVAGSPFCRAQRDTAMPTGHPAITRAGHCYTGYRRGGGTVRRLREVVLGQDERQPIVAQLQQYSCSNASAVLVLYAPCNSITHTPSGTWCESESKASMSASMRIGRHFNHTCTHTKCRVSSTSSGATEYAYPQRQIWLVAAAVHMLKRRSFRPHQATAPPRLLQLRCRRVARPVHTSHSRARTTF